MDLHNKVSEAGFSVSDLHNLNSEAVYRVSSLPSLIRLTKIPCEIIKTTLILLVTGQEFCVDVSTYEPVVWAEVPAEQCDTAFVKQCEDREEEVCADVTETRCQVSPDISLDIKVATSTLYINLRNVCQRI